AQAPHVAFVLAHPREVFEVEARLGVDVHPPQEFEARGDPEGGQLHPCLREAEGRGPETAERAEDAEDHLTHVRSPADPSWWSRPAVRLPPPRRASARPWRS